MSGGLKLSGTATVTVVPYEETLLGTARRMIDGGDFNIAVVVAHMACEVAVERALSRAWNSKGLSYLEGPVEDFLNGYNIAAPRLRNLHNALTEKCIQNESFWDAFNQSAARRNAIIHRGVIVSQADSKASLDAARAVIAYLK